MERIHLAASCAITGCLSSSPIPLQLSQASLSPIRVILAHFTLPFYERALRLPTSIPISGLARFGVKPRFCRSSRRALRPLTRSYFLLLPRRRLFLLTLRLLLGACLLSLWSPPLPLHALALILLSLAKVRLSLTSTLSHLTIWCSGLTALFLLLMAREALAYLPITLSVAPMPPFPFQQAQYAQVFPLKAAPFCTLFASLGSTNKSATSHLYFSYLTVVLSSPPFSLLRRSLYLKLSGRSGRNCFFFLPFLLGYNGSPDTCFSLETMRLMSWPHEEHYLRPP